MALSVHRGLSRTTKELSLDETKFYLFALALSFCFFSSLIILGDEIATFVDGQIIYTALVPGGSVNIVYQFFAAEDSVVCEFDNYKIWDLRSADFSP